MSRQSEELIVLDNEQMEVPEFKCTVPDDLLSKLSERDQTVIKTLNVMAQQIDFLTLTCSKLRHRQRAQAENFERLRIIMILFFSKWSPIVWLLGILGSWLVGKLLKIIWP